MEGDVLVVASKVRGFLKEKNVKMSGELIEALNTKVKTILEEASKRTTANKRSTVKPQDI